MGTFRHVGIVCNNIEPMIEFYSKLGKVVYDQVEKVRIVKFDNGVELLQYESMSENTLRALGICHVAFTLDPENNYLEVIKRNETNNC